MLDVPKRKVAALYVDSEGPYMQMDRVDPWDKHRDARNYQGPHPVVAHPPCGPWGMMHGLCKHQDKSLGPIAVEQVRKYGGVLEHPAGSRLWAHCNMTPPGKGVDGYAGYSIAVRQVSWGHCCMKPTWLYFVGVPLIYVMTTARTGGEPTHRVTSGEYGPQLPTATKRSRTLTPPEFAEWLVHLARCSTRQWMDVL